MQINNQKPDPSSFRDPSGVVFSRDGKIYRQVNACYKEQYDRLMGNGLYNKLIKSGLLIAHVECDKPGLFDLSYKVIEPKEIPFISYPYEWCFGQIKDAALTTLKAHRTALEYDMILKDASAYNIQFVAGQPVLIDTLSFDFYKENQPWVGYGQFCRHFLAPLFLSAYVDIRLSQLMRVYIDGIPLDLASKLLKGKGGGFAAWQHIHLHAKSTQKYGTSGQTDKPSKSSSMRITKFQMCAMIDSLIRIVNKLSLPNVQTEWGDYYSNTNYSSTAADSKAELLSGFLAEITPGNTWDFGANDGTYSRLALKNNAHVTAFDIDPIAVERNYSAVKKSRENLLPLILDLTNPSPAIGFANRERGNISSRQQPDCILMLAVIHHMAISNNLPFSLIAQWLASLCRHLIIEFIPKEDSQVKVLLCTRDDIFTNYHRQGFEDAFSEYFSIVKKSDIVNSERVLYLLESKIK